MIKRGISIKARGETEFISSEDLNLGVRTINVPLLATRRTGKENVLKKDGSYYYDDSFDVKFLTFKVEYFESLYFGTRQFNITKIAKYFHEADELILNYDSSKVYKVRLLTEINNDMLTTYNSFQVQFEAEPVQKNIYSKDYSPTWGTTNIPWNQADFPWGGYNTVFNNINSNTNLTLDNSGTYELKPTIILSGAGSSITLTNNTTNESFTYSNLNNETVYIECESRLVYRDGASKINKRANFDGDYIKLAIGTNDIKVIGSWSNLNIEFKYNENYL